MEEKKVKLILKDFLENHKNIEIKEVFLDLYDDFNNSLFQQLFAYFHQELNSSFEFMNQKIKVNNHYNADDSRFLLKLINELRNIIKELNKTKYKIILNKSYIDIIKKVKNFLSMSGGSKIPDDFNEISIIKYEPIFSFYNKNLEFKKSNIEKYIVNNNIDYTEYFSIDRINELKNIENNELDLSKFIKILEEVNINYKYNCYLGVSSLLRMLIDHIPPIFGCKNFSEVVNNYGFSKSDKYNMKHLFGALKNISDGNLHSQIGKKEILPKKQTIEFRADFDILIKNIIIRLNK